MQDMPQNAPFIVVWSEQVHFTAIFDLHTSGIAYIITRFLMLVQQILTGSKPRVIFKWHAVESYTSGMQIFDSIGTLSDTTQIFLNFHLFFMQDLTKL